MCSKHCVVIIFKTHWLIQLTLFNTRLYLSISFLLEHSWLGFHVVSGMRAHAWNPTLGKWEKRIMTSRSSLLHMDFKACLGYMKPCL